MTVAVDSCTGNDCSLTTGTWSLSYLLTDHLGSVVAVTSSTGTLIGQQRYLPFGQARTDTNPPFITKTDFGYTGQRNLDAQGNVSLGLLDYHARMYDDLLGRFIQPDTVTPGGPQGLNRFSYVYNNPINAADPTGNVTCRDDDFDCMHKTHNPIPTKGGSSGNGNNGNGGNTQKGTIADVGDFQLLPASYDYMTYGQIAQAGYTGYWLSGAPAYGDSLLPGFTVNSQQVGVGAAAQIPSLLVDFINIANPYIQKFAFPYNQSVSIGYSVQYYNVPRQDAFKTTAVTNLLIKNTSDQLVNYNIALSSPSNPKVVRSGVFTAAPNETVSALLPTNFTFTGAVNINVHAFTGCIGSCLVSNPPPPALAGYQDFTFTP